MLFLVWSRAIFAASFDCNKAQTNNEKLICIDSELSTLDVQLSERYQDKLQTDNLEERTTLQKAQLEWLQIRDQMCTQPPDTPHEKQSTVCLKTWYQIQIERLPSIYFQECDKKNPLPGCGGNLYYSVLHNHQAQQAFFQVYPTIARYVQKYEQKYGEGSAYPLVETLLQELPLVQKRIRALCDTYTIFVDNGHGAKIPLYGREGRSFHAPLCRVSEWKKYHQYLQEHVLKDLPSVE